MTAIVAVNFDRSIESCDKAPRDLNYERNTEKYGRAMKLTIDPIRKNGSDVGMILVPLGPKMTYLPTERLHLVGYTMQ